MPVTVVVTCRKCGTSPLPVALKPTFVTDTGFFVEADIDLPVGWVVVMNGSALEDVSCPMCNVEVAGGA